MVLRLGVRLGFGQRLSLRGLAYTGQIAGQADDHGVNANFVQRF
jgi:uncharacterized protein with beta-barrel porin domain